MTSYTEPYHLSQSAYPYGYERKIHVVSTPHNEEQSSITYTSRRRELVKFYYCVSAEARIRPQEDILRINVKKSLVSFSPKVSVGICFRWNPLSENRRFSLQLAPHTAPTCVGCDRLTHIHLSSLS